MPRLSMRDLVAIGQTWRRRRDAHGGHTGQNLLGVALMCVRDELIADVRARLDALAPAR